MPIAVHVLAPMLAASQDWSDHATQLERFKDRHMTIRTHSFDIRIDGGRRCARISPRRRRHAGVYANSGLGRRARVLCDG